MDLCSIGNACTEAYVALQGKFILQVHIVVITSTRDSASMPSEDIFTPLGGPGFSHTTTDGNYERQTLDPLIAIGHRVPGTELAV